MILLLFMDKKKPNLRKFFGAHKFTKLTDELMKEMDKDLYDE